MRVVVLSKGFLGLNKLNEGGLEVSDASEKSVVRLNAANGRVYRGVDRQGIMWDNAWKGMQVRLTLLRNSILDNKPPIEWYLELRRITPQTPNGGEGSVLVEVTHMVRGLVDGFDPDEWLNSPPTTCPG